MIQHIFKCTGFTIPLPGRYQLEIWWCPRGAEIPVHVHLNVSSWIWMVAGRMRWIVNHKEREVSGPLRHRNSNHHLALSAYKVPPRMPHGATVTGLFGLFINFERWNGPKASAATDIVW